MTTAPQGSEDLQMAMPTSEIVGITAAILGSGGMGALLSYRAAMAKLRSDSHHQKVEDEIKAGALAADMMQQAQEWLKQQDTRIKEITDCCGTLQKQIVEAQQQANDALRSASKYQTENILLQRQILDRDQIILSMQEKQAEIERVIADQEIMLDTSEKARASLEAARRQAEKALREAEARLLLTVANAPAATKR